jgi:hypothetical protein
VRNVSKEEMPTPRNRSGEMKDNTGENMVDPFKRRSKIMRSPVPQCTSARKMQERKSRSPMPAAKENEGTGSVRRSSRSPVRPNSSKKTTSAKKEVARRSSRSPVRPASEKKTQPAVVPELVVTKPSSRMAALASVKMDLDSLVGITGAVITAKTASSEVPSEPSVMQEVDTDMDTEDKNVNIDSMIETNAKIVIESVENEQIEGESTSAIEPEDTAIAEVSQEVELQPERHLENEKSNIEILETSTRKEKATRPLSKLNASLLSMGMGIGRKKKAATKKKVISPVPAAPEPVADKQATIENESDLVDPNLNPFVPKKRLAHSPERDTDNEVVDIIFKTTVKEVSESKTSPFITMALENETDELVNDIQEHEEGEEAKVSRRLLPPGEFKEYLKAFRSPRRKLRRSSMNKSLYAEPELLPSESDKNSIVDLSLNMSLNMSSAGLAEEGISASITEASEDVVNTADPFAANNKLKYSPASSQTNNYKFDENINPFQAGKDLAHSPPAVPVSVLLQAPEVVQAEVFETNVDVDKNESENENNENNAPMGALPPVPPDTSEGRQVLSEVSDYPIAPEQPVTIVETLQSEITRLQAEMAYRLATSTQDRLLEEARSERDSIKSWLVGFEKKMEETVAEKTREQEAMRLHILNADISASREALTRLDIETRLLNEKQRVRIGRWMTLSQEVIIGAPEATATTSSSASGSSYVPSYGNNYYEAPQRIPSTYNDVESNDHDDFDYGGGDNGYTLGDVDNDTTSNSFDFEPILSLKGSVKSSKSVSTKNTKQSRIKKMKKESPERIMSPPKPPPEVKGMRFIALELEPEPIKKKKPKIVAPLDDSALTKATLTDDSFESLPKKTKKLKEEKKEKKPKAVSKSKTKPKAKKIKAEPIKKSKKMEAKDAKPKRKPTAFINFSTSIRPSVKAENPEMTFGNIAKEISARWKKLSEDEKAEFVSPADDTDVPVAKVKKTKVTKEKVGKKGKAPTKKATKTKGTKRKADAPELSRQSPEEMEIAAFERFTAVAIDEVKSAQPEAGETELEQMIKDMWDVMTEPERNIYRESVGSAIRSITIESEPLVEANIEKVSESNDAEHSISADTTADLEKTAPLEISVDDNIVELELVKNDNVEQSKGENIELAPGLQTPVSEQPKKRKKLFSFTSRQSLQGGLEVAGTPDKENMETPGTGTGTTKKAGRKSLLRRSSGVPSIYSVLSSAKSYSKGITGNTLALKDRLSNPQHNLKPGPLSVQTPNINSDQALR